LKPSWGTALPEAANPLGVTEQTCSRWMRQYGGLGLDHAKRLSNLKKENTRHERLEAEFQVRRRHQAIPKQRMGWDLNPRTTFAVAGFQGRRRHSGDSRREHR
jgi:transposase